MKPDMPCFIDIQSRPALSRMEMEKEGTGRWKGKYGRRTEMGDEDVK